MRRYRRSIAALNSHQIQSERGSHANHTRSPGRHRPVDSFCVRLCRSCGARRSCRGGISIGWDFRTATDALARVAFPVSSTRLACSPAHSASILRSGRCRRFGNAQTTRSALNHAGHRGFHSARYLIAIGEHDILKDIFGEIWVPDAVVRELTTDSTPAEVRRIVSGRPAWLNIRNPPEKSIAEITHEIDEGERAALAIALELHAELVLLDGAAGRRAAVSLGLRITGTIGVLRIAASVN